MISKVPETNFEDFKVKIKHLIQTATKKNDEQVVEILKQLVPEFKSENSEFEVLDTKKKSEKFTIK